MSRKIEVLIIGTEPPCPRCDLLVLRVEEAATELGRPVVIRHCSYESGEAETVARRVGKRVGTAKQVAKEAGVPTDWDGVYEHIEHRKQAVGADRRPADTWTPELDAMLEPCRLAAEGSGFLMTPVLVVNGVVRHQGNVPPKDQVKDWLGAP
jgi:hypothetical protein